MIRLYLPLEGISSPSSGSFNKRRWGRAWELGVVGLTSKWKLQAGIRKKNKGVLGRQLKEEFGTHCTGSAEVFYPRFFSLYTPCLL